MKRLVIVFLTAWTANVHPPMVDYWRRLFFDIAGKTGVESCKLLVEGPSGSRVRSPHQNPAGELSFASLDDFCRLKKVRTSSNSSAKLFAEGFELLLSEWCRRGAGQDRLETGKMPVLPNQGKSNQKMRMTMRTRMRTRMRMRTKEDGATHKKTTKHKKAQQIF
jgi:hypothetical protein